MRTRRRAVRWVAVACLVSACLVVPVTPPAPAPVDSSGVRSDTTVVLVGFAQKRAGAYLLAAMAGLIVALTAIIRNHD